MVEVSAATVGRNITASAMLEPMATLLVRLLGLELSDSMAGRVQKLDIKTCYHSENFSDFAGDNYQFRIIVFPSDYSAI